MIWIPKLVEMIRKGLIDLPKSQGRMDNFLVKIACRRIEIGLSNLAIWVNYAQSEWWPTYTNFLHFIKNRKRIIRLLEIGLWPTYTNFLHFIKNRIQIVRLLEIGPSNIGLTLNIYIFQTIQKRVIFAHGKHLITNYQLNIGHTYINFHKSNVLSTQSQNKLL